MVEDLTSKFILTTQLTATLCISTCNLCSGGCYSFGTNLADELKCDYLGVQVNESVRPKQINFIKSKMDEKNYQTIIVTGCFFDNHLPLLEIHKKYPLTELKQIYAIAPPWIIIENEEYKKELNSLTKEYSRASSAKITLLTSGMETARSHCIGLPSPFPPLSLGNERKFNIPNCYGLIYIRELLTLDIMKHSKTFTQHYLSAYFYQISLLAHNKSIETPSVIAIIKTTNEFSIIKQEAKKYNINIIACNAVSPEDYVLALKTIGKNGGSIACNGSHTTTQAILLKCNILFYGNREINSAFLTQLLETIPYELKKIAGVVLGLYDQFDLLKNTVALEAVREILETNMQTSYNKFKKIKTNCISVLPLLKSTVMKPTPPHSGKLPRSKSYESFFDKQVLKKPCLSFYDDSSHLKMSRRS